MLVLTLVIQATHSGVSFTSFTWHLEASLIPDTDSRLVTVDSVLVYVSTYYLQALSKGLDCSTHRFFI